MGRTVIGERSLCVFKDWNAMFTGDVDLVLSDLALQTADGPRWLLAGDGAAVALGVLGIAAPPTLTLVCAGADRAQIAAFLPATAPIRLEADPRLCFDGGDRALNLATAWHHRGRVTIEGPSIAVLPLEYLLLTYLSPGEQQRATLVARHLHQRGFDYDVIASELSMAPVLELAVVDVMQKVIPLSRRAARRRAVREADRKEMEWFTQKGARRDD
jgi:hypothetical protein